MISTNFLTHLHFFHLQHKCCSVIPKKYLILCSLFTHIQTTWYSSLRLPSFRTSPTSGLPNNCVKRWKYSTNPWVFSVMFCLQNDKPSSSSAFPSFHMARVVGIWFLGNITCETSLITYVTLLWLLENYALNNLTWFSSPSSVCTIYTLTELESWLSLYTPKRAHAPA